MAEARHCECNRRYKYYYVQRKSPEMALLLNDSRYNWLIGCKSNGVIKADFGLQRCESSGGKFRWLSLELWLWALGVWVVQQGNARAGGLWWLLRVTTSVSISRRNGDELNLIKILFRGFNLREVDSFPLDLFSFWFLSFCFTFNSIRSRFPTSPGLVCVHGDQKGSDEAA